MVVGLACLDLGRWSLQSAILSKISKIFQMSILINTFVACHKKFKIRIEKELMTESVVFFIKLHILNVLAVPLVNVYFT